MEVPQWFKDQNIRTKIYTLQGLVGLFAAAIVGYSYYTLNKISNQLHDVSDNIPAGSIDSTIQLSLQNVHNTADGATKVILFLWVFTSLAAILVAVFIVNYLSNALNRMVNVAKRISNYNLTANIRSLTKDEIGRLFGTLGEMIVRQRDIVTHIRGSSEKVLNSSHDLASTTEQMNATMEQMSSTIQEITKGAQLQSHQVDTANVEMQKIAEMVQAINTSVKVAAENSKEAEKIAQGGGKSAEVAFEKMAEIKEIVGVSANVVTDLGERSKQISEIIEVITNIAKQTNLLALNAAIEAARAGEHGRGFAVVAEEVKQLADESAGAAERVSQLIVDIQADTKMAVETMDKGKKGVEDGTEVTNEALLALQNIVVSVEQNTEEVAKISRATDEQLVAVRKLEESISEIASAAEQAAASTQEAAAASEEQTAGMQEVSSSAQVLKDLALELQEIVKRFKIEKEKKRVPKIGSPTPKWTNGKAPLKDVIKKHPDVKKHVQMLESS